LCVWSLVIAAVVIVVVNLTVARLPTMPPADGKYISLQARRMGDELHHVDHNPRMAMGPVLWIAAVLGFVGCA